MYSYKCPFPYLLVLDFETTSDGKTHDYPTEVIQFSIVPFDVRAKTILVERAFNEYVHPTINPILTKHCADFTGIQQLTLNAADTFPIVFQKFLGWLQNNGFEEENCAIVCDSRQDMWRIAQYQFRLINQPLPSLFRQWVNIKKIFDTGLEPCEKRELIGKTNIEKMVKYLEIEQIGIAHDALSDCLTLANITHRILEWGCPVTVNEMVYCSPLWRKHPIDMSLYTDWRTNFMSANRIFERVLPLAVRSVSNYDKTMFGICSYCKKGNTVCGVSHTQPPVDLYNNLPEPCVFAKCARYY